MKKTILEWVKTHPIRAMFLVPIFLVAGISISHVVSWYNLTNPISWAIYLSIAIEIGAMTALLAATNKIKGGVWFMFGMVTFIQMIGNIFFSYKEIDANSVLFKSWVELTGPIWEMFGSDLTDVVSLKRWLAFLSGGLLPIISLTSLHFFVKYDELIDDNNKSVIPVEVIEKSSGIIIDEFSVTELDNMSNVVQSDVFEEPIEDIVEESIEELIEDVVEEPIEEVVEELIEEPIEEPIEEVVEELIEEPIEEPIEELIEDVVEDVVEESIEEVVEEPIEEPIEEVVEELIEEPIEEVVEEPIEEPIEEVVEEPIEEVVNDIVRLSYVKTS
jgi:hypothetical protein